MATEAETTTGNMLEDRAVIRLSGDDVRGFLNGLVTNDIMGALPVWAGLLTPQGKALFDFIIWADGDDLLIDCEAEAVDALVKRLSIYRLRRAITIKRDDGLAVHWSITDTQGVPDPRHADLGHRWIAVPGAPANGWLAHRLSLGVTEGLEELGSDQILWLECNADRLHGVSFNKGCYVGQENTARMNWRQKINRRLAVVTLADAEKDPARVRVRYPALGLAVIFQRVEN